MENRNEHITMCTRSRTLHKNQVQESAGRAEAARQHLAAKTKSTTALYCHPKAQAPRCRLLPKKHTVSQNQGPGRPVGRAEAARQHLATTALYSSRFWDEKWTWKLPKSNVFSFAHLHKHDEAHLLSYFW